MLAITPPCCLIAVLLATPAGADGDHINFGRDIRPILSDRCAVCHGPDISMRKARLRLDTFEHATAPRRRGKFAIVPGDPDASEVWRRISAEDPLDRMPPPESTKHRLTPEEQALIREWILQGAIYDEHWSFETLDSPGLPFVMDESWPRTPVDRFVLARLEADDTNPSPEADPATLCRRIFLDLTGLPPTVEELDRFLADEATDAYERLVDRLLEEEPYRTRYAEHMATPWMDLARYADTAGIHMDAGRSIWLWRDWVIDAYRDNMPMNQFITEQLAGDLMPDATIEQKIASGFNRCHVTSDEGGAIDDELLFMYAVDRTNTYGTVFLGLTIGCAQCHDHKFDPVSMEDYYGLLAFFNSNNEPGLYSQIPDATRALEPQLQIFSSEDEATLAAIATHIESLEKEQAEPTAEEAEALTSFKADLQAQGGWNWIRPSVESATSSHGSTLTVQDDGSVLASGENPAIDDYSITLRTDDTNLNAVLLEVLEHESLPHGRPGRAANGNMIMSGIEGEVVSIADPTQRVPISFHWAWADVEQSNADHHVVGILQPDNKKVWAIGAHEDSQDRVAMFLAEAPFGFEGGSDITLNLQFHSPYAQHAPGRIRLSLGAADEPSLSRLPLATSGWYIVGPFATTDGPEAYDTIYGPESESPLNHQARFHDRSWRYAPGVKEDELVTLAQGVGAEFVARDIYAPTARTLPLSMGSDDGLQVYLDGRKVFENRVDRGVAKDQDQFTIDLPAGQSTMVCKFVNTGGTGGMYHRADVPDDQLFGDTIAMVLPDEAVAEPLSTRASKAWRLAFSPRYRAIAEAIDVDATRADTIRADAPRTMIMEDLPEPRMTYIMKRGAYDGADESRPVSRRVPSILGELDSDTPDRLDLAQWTVSDHNPITARVLANRLWYRFFGTGISETVEDLGMQGTWPSHPALLDWLATDLREEWDLQDSIRTIVLSATYRQQSGAGSNKLLGHYPRQRLGAEVIRDQALHVSGLLVEASGGASVKPYQPDGLWKEVAMPQSNTRIFEQDMGGDLWRRSLYTYWKRAAPPPSMLTFDAPTREFCSSRRLPTNTPLQALVLWNDPQFVEAARHVAARTLEGAPDTPSRLNYLYRLCTGTSPSGAIAATMTEAIEYWLNRYGHAPEDAAAMLAVGESSDFENLPADELAAWAMVASAVLSSDATIVKD